MADLTYGMFSGDNSPAGFTVGNLQYLFPTTEAADYAAGDYRLIGAPSLVDEFRGNGFTYNALGVPTGGTVSEYRETLNGNLVLDLSGGAIRVTDLEAWSSANAGGLAAGTVFAGDDTIQGTSGNDVLEGYAGNDAIHGNGGNDVLIGDDGNDSLFGGSGNDSFVPGTGTNYLSGGGGSDTAILSGAASSYSFVRLSSGALVASGDGATDSLNGVATLQFSDRSIAATAVAANGFAAVDTSLGKPVSDLPQGYSGPVAGLLTEYITVTNDNLNISASTDNWFIHSGNGTDAIAVSGGTNVLDGGPGSNFLTGGSGTDTFFVDDRAAPADLWSTVVNFHASDDATVWGITPGNFNLAWADGQGAGGYTGLTFHATEAGHPTASLTLAGYSQADLGNGRLAVSFGNIGGNTPYMVIHANG
ncbi:MAG TPA: calcium-binding protein [Acetobacteraceae bacterium]|nr:calcium-binding protein [Acetobacteraceae bacterium]